jgi:epsilon-lactone hydrolase
MASPQIEAAKDVLRAWHEQVMEQEVLPTVEEQRAATAAFAEFTGVPDGVTYVDVDAGGVPAQWTVPEGAADDRVLLYVHGGGYVVCSVATHSRLVGHIATAIGCRALNVDYRLAPEHPHPAAVTDSTAAYRWLLDQGIAPEHVAVAGDSAGGGLTVATLVKIRDEGLPQPAAAVALSPWVDLEGIGESMDTNAGRDLMINRDGLKRMADQFLGGADARDPLAAPLYADLTGIAALYVQVGAEETLLSDATRLATNAAIAGVDVRLDVFPEMQHVFQLQAGIAPEADEAVVRIGQWLRPRLGLPG